MARFIVDTDIEYLTDKPKNKREFTVKEIKTDIKELQNVISDAIMNYHDGCVSITCIEEHNTAQFHENPVYNKLTTKQIRRFNQNPHG